jgi:hypothetical protein
MAWHALIAGSSQGEQVGHVTIIVSIGFGAANKGNAPAAILMRCSMPHFKSLASEGQYCRDNPRIF